MKTTSNDKLIAYLTLFSGLSISAVAIYYSVMGLIAIYPAMIVPIIVMGIAIELGKLSATVWLKQSWEWAPRFLKAYILPAIVLLMLITSIGVFGFLSKAHSDQSLVSGDVQAKISVYDEKIKTEKDNIDANRKSLKQMDEAVDQVMARSTTEGGADKAVAIRRSQQKERARILADITASQTRITSLNELRAPIAAEVRKVEAEVGPIKYIAAFIYGDNPDANVLERAVTWVSILIVIVLDPLAVVLLLASQYSFQRIREQEDQWPTMEEHLQEAADAFNDVFADELANTDKTPEEIMGYPAYEPDDGPLTDEQVEQIQEEANRYLPKGDIIAEETLFPEYQVLDEADDEEPAPELDASDERPGDYIKPAEIVDRAPTPIKTGEGSRMSRTKVFPRASIVVPLPETYVQNEEQTESNLWSTATETTTITQDEYMAKSRKLFTKEEDEELHIQWCVAEVRHGRLTLDDVPPNILDQVKARL
jgi:hypothetical protein